MRKMNRGKTSKKEKSKKEVERVDGASEHSSPSQLRLGLAQKVGGRGNVIIGLFNNENGEWLSCP